MDKIFNNFGEIIVDKSFDLSIIETSKNGN